MSQSNGKFHSRIQHLKYRMPLDVIDISWKKHLFGLAPSLVNNDTIQNVPQTSPLSPRSELLAQAA